MATAKPARRGVPQPLHGGPQRFGPYSLEARLAVGSTTEVYLARVADRDALETKSFPERFVVKRLLPHLVADAEGRGRFEREAMLHAAVSHANVVSVFGIGVTSQGEPFLAMEYIDGVDAFRLLRRTTHERSVLPVGVSVHVTREVLLGLTAVHHARDPFAGPLGIVHRDVTPSNIYLSRAGDVKLGDFGIARSLLRPTTDAMATTGEVVAQDASLMGKYSYLAPEQVAGEPFDHRADLFSTATVLAELLIGKPLFPGTGQLQVLLAIRDCNLKPLRDAAARLPPGLPEVVEKALSRDPAHRFPDADAFHEALAPFVSDAAEAKRALALRVASVQQVPSDMHLAAVRESSRALRAAAAVPLPSDTVPTPAVDPSAPAPATLDDEGVLEIDVAEAFAEELDAADIRDTGVYPDLLSFVQRASGERLGPFSFGQLVDAIATGKVGRGDRVDYIGIGFRRIEDIPDLVKLLPKSTLPPAAPPTESPAYSADLSVTTMLDVLAYVLASGESGLLLVEGPPRDGETAPQRREIYFLRGRMHHVASTGERLGEFLVRRGKLTREELDMALAILPKYGGRIGDTLIGLGLVEGVDIFRAIRELGQARVTELFLWTEGLAHFHPEQPVAAVEFPLDLDLPTLMLAGMEASHPGDSPMAFIEPQLDTTVSPNARSDMATIAWPPVVDAVRAVLTRPMPLRQLLATVARSGTATGPDVARALEVLLAMDLARWD